MILLALIGQLFGTSPAFLGAANPRSSAPPPDITFNLLASRATSTDGTSFATTATYTPTANAVVLAAVVSTKAAAPDIPSSFTGNNLTWIMVATTNFSTSGSPTARVTLFYGTGASPTTTVGTVDFGAATQTGANIMIVEFPNASTSAPFVQTNVVSGDGQTALGNTLVSAMNADSRNAMYATFGNNKLPFGGAVKANFTEDYDIGYSTPTTGGYVMHLLATTDNSAFTTNVSNSTWGSIAVEVNAQR